MRRLVSFVCVMAPLACSSGADSPPSTGASGGSSPTGSSGGSGSAAPTSSSSGSSGSSSSSGGASGSSTSSSGSSPILADAGTVSVFADAPPYVETSGGDGHHDPGENCFTCHGQGSAPSFTFGGTIYDATGKAAAGVEVRLLDTNGTATSVYSGTNGNFYLEGEPLSSTAHAGARDSSGVEQMPILVPSGACNSCHCTTTGCLAVPLHVP